MYPACLCIHTIELVSKVSLQLIVWENSSRPFTATVWQAKLQFFILSLAWVGWSSCERTLHWAVTLQEFSWAAFTFKCTLTVRSYSGGNWSTLSRRFRVARWDEIVPGAVLTQTHLRSYSLSTFIFGLRPCKTHHKRFCPENKVEIFVILVPCKGKKKKGKVVPAGYFL